MINNQVYIHEIKNSKYPDKSDNFSPSTCYPEYMFPNEISGSENKVYEMVRECLFHMGFDREHYGSNEWNPLKEIIKPGDVVLLKPNMVLHENEKPENGIECLITHPSLVRAILDYVVLALCGNGRIIVGDAPLQSCNFEKLIKEQGYTNIIDFYKKMGISVELVDFRNYKTISRNGLLYRVENKADNEHIVVNLGKNSEFVTINQNQYRKLRITNYDYSIMHEHHNCEKNEYSIAKQVLEADVIINMPKPKTHRKAGVTISLKNLVGINTNKEWLPHHTEGSIDEGGDEYLAKSFLKKMRTYFIKKRDTFISRNLRAKARIYNNIAHMFSILCRILNKDNYSEGSWYGNDTIWRTILDLNKIIFYADKQGNMQKHKQRKMLILADMIVSGEGEGPLLPSPRDIGIIAMGMNPVCFDEAISAIMGFQPTLIPSINNAKNVKEYVFDVLDKTIISSNNPIYNGRKPKEISCKDSLQFKPSIGWQRHF